MPGLPFHSFSFTLVENMRPRTAFRLTAGGGGLYDLTVQRGSAANPSSQITRQVPLEVAERLRDALQRIGVFGWDESYGDAQAPGSRRWTLGIVFQEGVFALESRGGSDVPPGFDDLLEELYRMDFPRPVAAGAAAGVPAPPPASMGDLAAFASRGGFPGLDSPELSELRRRMKDELGRLSPAERRRLVDTLVQSGMGTRAFWEDFFRNL